jgi:hypothetical protein
MRRAGAQAKLTQPHSYGDQTPDDFARAVVGHDLIRGVGDVYRDLNQPHLSRTAIDLAWRELREQPVALGLNPAAIGDACERVEYLSDARSEYLDELDAIERRQAALSGVRSRSAGGERDQMIVESNALVFALARLQDKIATVSSALDKACADLEVALKQETKIEMEDQSAYFDALDAATQRAARALSRDHGTAGTLSVRDVSRILGKTPQTINTWIRTRKLTPYWQIDAWTTSSNGHRQLPTRMLLREALTPLQREKLLLAELRHDRLAA